MGRPVSCCTVVIFIAPAVVRARVDRFEVLDATCTMFTVQGLARIIPAEALSRRGSMRSVWSGVYLYLERNGAQQERCGRGSRMDASPGRFGGGWVPVVTTL